jgi:hypothetical protein
MKKLLVALLISLLCGCQRTAIHTGFHTAVCIKPYKRYEYHVCHDIEFTVNHKKFTIPKGFKTDLASIPRSAWSVISPAHSAVIRGAIVHDWFYRKTCDFDRKQTDIIFYHMLINDGLWPLTAGVMYYAVRWFGGKYYNEDYCD